MTISAAAKRHIGSFDTSGTPRPLVYLRIDLQEDEAEELASGRVPDHIRDHVQRALHWEADLARRARGSHQAPGAETGLDCPRCQRALHAIRDAADVVLWLKCRVCEIGWDPDELAKVQK